MDDEEVARQVKQYLEDNPKVVESMKQFNIDFRQYMEFVNQITIKPSTRLSSSTSK